MVSWAGYLDFQESGFWLIYGLFIGPYGVLDRLIGYFVIWAVEGFWVLKYEIGFNWIVGLNKVLGVSILAMKISSLIGLC